MKAYKVLPKLAVTLAIVIMLSVVSAPLSFGASLDKADEEENPNARELPDLPEVEVTYWRENWKPPQRPEPPEYWKPPQRPESSKHGSWEQISADRINWHVKVRAYVLDIPPWADVDVEGSAIDKGTTYWIDITNWYLSYAQGADVIFTVYDPNADPHVLVHSVPNLTWTIRRLSNRVQLCLSCKFPYRASFDGGQVYVDWYNVYSEPVKIEVETYLHVDYISAPHFGWSGEQFWL